MFMPVELPSPYERIGIRGHAHPSPEPAAMPTHDILAGVTFEVELRGLATQYNASPQSMQRPQLRSSEYKRKAITHLDVVSCWKGISNAQALELTLWERKFQQCLIMYIEERLRCAIATQLAKCKERTHATTLLYLFQCLPDQHVRLVQADIPKLVRDMIESFYEDHPGATAARNFHWSVGSGDLPSFVYNFVSTHDCFQQTEVGLCIFVKFNCDFETYPVVNIIADVGWQPPDVKFDHLPQQLELGEQYPIVPFYDKPLGRLDILGFKSYIDDVHYTVSKSSSPEVYWDPEEELFCLRAPETEKQGHKPTVAQTEIKACIITHFPDNVRFERTSRWDIKINVVKTRHLNGPATQLKQQTKTLKMPWALLLSKVRQDKCIRAFTLVGQRLPETMPQLKGLIPELNKVNNTDRYYAQATASQNSREDSPMQDVPTYEPQHESEPPKKRKDRAISGVPSQVFCWHGFLHHRDVKLKRRKLEKVEGPNAHIDPTFQADLRRMARHVGVSSFNPSADDDAETKTVSEALRLLLHCIERGKFTDQHRRDFVRRLTVPIFDAMELAQDSVDIPLSQQLSELSQAARKMVELNEKAKKLLQEKRNKATQVQQQSTPPSSAIESDSDMWAELDRAATKFYARSAEKLPEHRKVDDSFVQQRAIPRSVIVPDSSDTSSSTCNNTDDFPELGLLQQYKPLASTVNNKPTELVQEQIQANYVEFEEMAKRKADLSATDSSHARKDSIATGSTDTIGDMDFERIFVGDSDAEDSWHSSDVSVWSNGDMEDLDVEGHVGDGDGDGRMLEERLGYWG